MHWTDLQPGIRLLLVPIGSCEQHGPHLPLDTDTLLAGAFADALADARRDAVVAPPVTFGASGEHQRFPGTLSIGTAALRDVAVELARSALPPPASPSPGSFEAVLFVNAHGGNVEALTTAERILGAESRSVAVWHPRVEHGDLHAGNTETSLMLHLFADRVDMERAEPGSSTPLDDLRDALRRDGLAEVAPNGVLGDPTTASESEGRALFIALLGDLERVAGELLTPPSDRDS